MSRLSPEFEEWRPGRRFRDEVESFQNGPGPSRDVLGVVVKPSESAYSKSTPAAFFGVPLRSERDDYIPPPPHLPGWTAQWDSMVERYRFTNPFTGASQWEVPSRPPSRTSHKDSFAFIRSTSLTPSTSSDFEDTTSPPYAIVNRRIDKPKSYRQSLETIISPGRGRSRSPVMRARRSPVALGLPRQAVQIVQDEIGDKYYAPNTSTRQFEATPVGYREREYSIRPPVLGRHQVDHRRGMSPPRQGFRIVRDEFGNEYHDTALVTSTQQNVAPPVSYREPEYDAPPPVTMSGRGEVNYGRENKALNVSYSPVTVIESSGRPIIRPSDNSSKPPNTFQDMNTRFSDIKIGYTLPVFPCQRPSVVFGFMCPTISKDNTPGEYARKSELLASYGKRLQRGLDNKTEQESDWEDLVIPSEEWGKGYSTLLRRLNGRVRVGEWHS